MKDVVGQETGTLSLLKDKNMKKNRASLIPTDHMAHRSYLIDGQQYTPENRTERSIKRFQRHLGQTRTVS
ncbi:hypothetical protein NEUTE2DRAFT_74539 [Neurospora tetrasperma FGSC 2509]|nr:hypothetical protein NEUTE2DRAFT_74539 [Neurospora tetrasperma FGSC 2509]